MFKKLLQLINLIFFFYFILKLGKSKSSKKAKTEPSREEMHAVVVDILKDVDFNTVSSTAVLHIID